MKKAWISCLVLAGLLLIAGCSPKKHSAKLPEASSAVSASSGTASSQTTSAQEEPAVQPEESGAPSPEEGGSQEQEPGPDPEPDPPLATWTLLPDRGDPTWMPSPLYEPEELPSCVTARPVQDEYTTDDTSIGVCVQNTGDKYFLFDLEYRLEKSTQEGWTDLDLKPYPIVEDWFLCVEPGQSKTQAYSLSNLVQPPEPGLYRIILGVGGRKVSCAFTLRMGDPLKARVRNAMFYGDQAAGLGEGHIAVIPRRRVYPVGVQTIRADYVNTSGESVYLAPEPQCFILEKALDSGWARIPYAEHASFPETPVAVEPHSETARGFDLSLLDAEWLTAGDYRILVKAPDGSDQEWMTCSFSLSEQTAG